MISFLRKLRSISAILPLERSGEMRQVPEPKSRPLVRKLNSHRYDTDHRSSAAPISNHPHMNTNIIGQWKNQYGSQLNIDQVDQGRITGSFKSAVDKSIPASPVFGLCTGNLVVFNVASSKEGEKIASWTGVLQDDRIETLWHVAVGGRGMWEAMLTGADTFTRL
jgi:hypothetical protein